MPSQGGSAGSNPVAATIDVLCDWGTRQQGPDPPQLFTSADVVGGLNQYSHVVDAYDGEDGQRRVPLFGSCRGISALAAGLSRFLV